MQRNPQKKDIIHENNGSWTASVYVFMDTLVYNFLQDRSIIQVTGRSLLNGSIRLGMWNKNVNIFRHFKQAYWLPASSIPFELRNMALKAKEESFLIS